MTRTPDRELRAPETTPVTNETIAALMAHRTIRAFTDEPLDDGTIITLLDVARHAATSSFQQQTTIIRVTDPAIREVVHAIPLPSSPPTPD